MLCVYESLLIVWPSCTGWLCLPQEGSTALTPRTAGLGGGWVGGGDIGDLSS